MKNIILSFWIFILFNTCSLFGQIVWQKSDKIVYIGDSIIFYPDKYRGDIQWQKSDDLIDWSDISGGNVDSLRFKADKSAYFRVRIHESNCDPFYSDTICLAAIEKKTYSFNVSNFEDSIRIEDKSSPLNNVKITIPENTFKLGDQINISFYVDTLQRIDTMLLPLGPVLEIKVDGLEDTLSNPVNIEFPINEWSLDGPYIPVIAHYIDSTNTWKIISGIDIRDSVIVFQTNHFSLFGAFLLNVSQIVYNAFVSETEATAIYAPYLKELEVFNCALDKSKIAALESIKEGCFSYMESLDLSNCDGFCGGVNNFLSEIDNKISAGIIKKTILSSAFLQYIGITGGVATGITILGSVPTLIFAPCVHCIQYNSTLNPALWLSLATYYMAEWGIKYLEILQSQNCSIESGIIFNPTLTYGSLNDIDGNIYKTIQIGPQTWMAENLKTTKYNDGTAISNITDGTTWSNLTSPGYCWYNNDATTYKSIYGALYNWYTVSASDNGGKNVCPTGWHVPSDAEWTTLTTYLGGESVAGGKLKEVGLIHWASPNTGATNESGFTALPGGGRNEDGTFSGFGLVGCWWSPLEFSATGAWLSELNYNLNIELMDHASKVNGFSVRCIKDETIPFKNESYNLNDNQVPPGWEFTATNPVVSLADGRLNAYPTDAYGYLRRKGTVPNDVTQIKFEWDGNLAYTFWGMLNILQLNYSTNKYIQTYLETAQTWSSTNNYLFLQYNSGSGNSQQLEKLTIPLQHGEFHYTVTVSNSSIKFICKNIGTQQEYVNQDISIPLSTGFSLQTINSCNFITYTTTDNINWLDNISITLIK